MHVKSCLVVTMCKRIPQKVLRNNKKTEKRWLLYIFRPPHLALMYIYTHTALPPSLPVVHHLSLDGNSAHTEASPPIRRHIAPHAYRPLTPNQLGRWSQAVSQSVHAHPHTYTHKNHRLINPKLHHRPCRQTDRQTLVLKVDFKVEEETIFDSIHIPATQSCANTKHTLPKATPSFRCPHRISTTSVW